MATLNKMVIQEAFSQVLGRLAPATLQDCIDEFSSTYPVLGTEEAFRNALTLKASSVDASTYDNLFIRFESALKEAQAEQKEKAKEEKERREQRRREAKTEAEKQATRQEAEDLRREVSDKGADFKLVLNDARGNNRNILAVARDVRKLARDSGFGASESVLAALGAVEDIAGKDGEVNSLISEADKISKEVQEAVRNSDPAAIDSSIGAIEAIRDRLSDILAIGIEEAKDEVEAAIQAAEDAKSAEEKKTAIKKAVDDSADAITAAEGIVKSIKDGVTAYKLAYLDLHGKELVIDGADVDNVDKLVERASQALTDAKAANARVISASDADDQTVAEAEALVVVAEREKAQKEFDKLTTKSSAVNEAKALQDTKKSVETRRETEDEEAKAKKVGLADKILGSWITHVVMVLGLLPVGMMVAWLVFPWWLQAIYVLGVIFVLASYAISWLKRHPEKGLVAVGTYVVVTLAIASWLMLVPVIGTGPGNGHSFIPETPTTEPTAEPTARMDAVATTPPDETPTATEPPD